jgi:hypothetical protein
MNTPKIFHRSIESELLTGSAFRGGRQHDGFVDNFKKCSTLYLGDPEYDLTQYFTDVTRRSNYPQLVEDDVENRLTRHDDEEYIYGGKIRRTVKKNTTGRRNKRKLTRSKTVKRKINGCDGCDNVISMC